MIKSAVLMGTGPSLKEVKFDLLNRFPSFATGRIAPVFDMTGWRPDYYVLVTTAIIGVLYEEMWADLRRAAHECRVKAFIWDVFKGLPQLGEADHFTFIHCTEEDDIRADQPGIEIWSDDIRVRVSKFGTSMLAVMQIAAWMRFERLYLLGIDGNYKDFDKSKDDPNHFTVDYRGDREATDFEEVNRAHRRAFEITRDNLTRLGIEAYEVNCQPGYGLFPSLSLEDMYYAN